jgi:thiol:disulfide interchange protein
MATTLLFCLSALEIGLALSQRAKLDACDGGHDVCALPPSPATAVDDPSRELPAGPALVELTSEACPACRSMEPVLRALREQCLGASTVQVDVESTTGAPLAARLNVTATPTLVLFDGDHHEAARLVGQRSLADVRKTIEQAFGIACSTRTGAPSPSG